MKIVSIGLFFILVSCSTQNKNDEIVEASLLRGKYLYNSHCITCHGQDGSGNGTASEYQIPKPTDLRKLVREVKDFKFFMSISQLHGQMPGWKEPYNEDDREALVAYIKSFR